MPEMDWLEWLKAEGYADTQNPDVVQAGTGYLRPPWSAAGNVLEKRHARS